MVSIDSLQSIDVQTEKAAQVEPQTATAETTVRILDVYSEEAESLESAVAPELKKEEIQDVVAQANSLMDVMNKKLEFDLDDRAENQMIVRVVDKESGKVIRQYPAEEMLNVMAKLEETILGVFVDDSA